MVVLIPPALRKFTSKKSKVQVTATTVGQAIDALESSYPGIRKTLLSDSNELRRFVSVFVDNKDIRALDGLGTATKDGSVVTILMAAAGG